MKLGRGLAPYLIVGLVFGTGCGVDYGTGGSGTAPASFAIQTTSLPFGVVDSPYSSNVAVTGGAAPFTWNILGGTLPAGLVLHPATGQITGTPSGPAVNSNLTLQVKDRTGRTATGLVLLAVHPRTDRVSLDNSGATGNGASSDPSISGEGRFVAFVSSSTNLLNPIGPAISGRQIYIRDRQINVTELVSRDNSASAISAGNGPSSAPSISGDGRFVAFVSQATNLLAPGPAVPAGQQVYVRDRQTGVTSLVSVDNNPAPVSGNGPSSAPSISGDGRFVAFVSQATNLLAPGPAVPAGQQVYVRDRQSGVTSLVSVDNNAAPVSGNGPSSTPSISGDGRFVAFVSQATNLLAPGTPAVPAGQQVYVRDRQSGVTSLVSVDNNTPPLAGNGVSSTPSLSMDGRIVAFDSLATNLLAPTVPTVSGRQVYVRDRLTSQTSLVSVDNSLLPNAGDGTSRTASVSGDGRFVTFVSAAANLLGPPPAPAISGQQIYVRDRLLGQTRLVSQDNSNTDAAGNDLSDESSTNANGAFAAFFSQASNLVSGAGAFSDIYVRAIP